ncbi:inorganic phosphate transporter [Megasphaera cerevisiae DSM 20462]|jgi:PiT family inorganic phosphate transporter|uniref:Inorganic phosphate transporter n=1 Tax=Megasphaera cerevisiae DSM 20462 TaxID=1122219 RepID=A0A0J6ZPC4_9FIRM|nr:inorganic phosphate transporter [Megasphaera cerevisiae]KMO86741.1 inorganic phosphate transporter [Megasphaera cerevisiae DSM 20462]MCI1751232.1 inorganic phosphate transporter [Megasphaera cerevisiae]OKY53703.1 anion permease [Megasphaera cerevisiae]SJZ93309.1 inorganic phosphate transporter, PiT family [Megasphaera cerevisiae DSM 20462]
MLDTYFIIMVVVLALVFDFINGFHDTANAIATCVSTRAIRPGIAIVGTAVLNFIGAMISTGVAKTIGGDIVVSPAMINELIIIAGLTGAIAWNLLTWWFGMPSSSSHALIGGMIGAILISVGTAALNDWGIIKIVLSLIISPVTAIVMGYIIMNILFIICRNYKPAKINITANRLQVISAALMAFSHGSNDAQKSMGIITLALVSGGFINSLEVPTIVKFLCAAAMALGTSVGGWKIIRTVGGKIFKMHPIHGFAADLNSAVVIFAATMLHLPVSTTHVVSGSIMGVGAAQRVKAVHWSVARQMVTAWVLTIPCTALMGAVSYCIISYVMVHILPSLQ